MSETVNKIKALSLKAATDKASEKQKQLEVEIDKDIKIIEDILTLVGDDLLYKEIGDRKKKYVVVDEAMVLYDYSNPPKYGSGTGITYDEGGYWSYPHTIVRVNGHSYYHARDLIKKYKFDAQKAVEKSEREYSLAKERQEALESMDSLEPLMKELMTSYTKTLNKYKEA